MKLTLQFFDHQSWSVHGTLKTVIPLVLMTLFKLKLDVQSLIFVSIMGMMKGDLLAQVIFTGFLNFITYKRSKEWILRSIIYVISTYLMNKIKFGNKIEKWILNSDFNMLLFKLLIFAWMGYILWKILTPINKWSK